MLKYVNPLCNSSLSIATSFNFANNECTWRRGQRITSPFGGSVASDERELPIDESVTQSNAVPNLQFVPDFDVVVIEVEDSVRGALEEVEASDSRTEEASEGDDFVDIMGGFEKETGVESEGFTFEDILQRADLLPETVLEGVVDTPDLPLC